ncbi:MAG: glycosyltransferase [Gemmatimonadota bacterium]
MSRPPDKRFRVLQVIQNLNYGGMERLLADIVRQADPARFESHVLALGYLGRFSEGLEQYASLHLSPALPFYSLLWPSPLIRTIQAIAPDVVHMHSGVWYKVSLAARHARVPKLIFTEHGRPAIDRWLPRMLDRAAARRTDVVVAVSETVAARLRQGIVTPRSRMVVVENGVDVQVYRPRPDNGKIRGELGISPQTPIIGSVGRLEHIKGYDVMIQAYALLLQRWTAGTPPALVVGGDGAERDRCLTAAKAHHLESVFLLGWRDDIHDMHAAFQLFTMSSRSEGTSVSLLEAMSAGLCPVVTDVGGNAAVLGEHLRHRLVATENPSALADAWMAALMKPEKCAADGANARRRVEDSFSLGRMVKRYEDLYAEPAQRG